MSAAPFDLLALDRDVAVASARLDDYRRVILQGASPSSIPDPFAGTLRATSQKSVYDALISDGSAHALALATHVRYLLTARLRDKTETPRALARAKARVRVSLPGAPSQEVSEATLLEMLASCTHAVEASILVDAAATLGGQEIGLAKADRDLAAELAHRISLFDVQHGPDLVGSRDAPRFGAAPSEDEPVETDLAAETLAKTADLAAHALPGTGGSQGTDYAQLLRQAFAHDAGGSLPARLSAAHVAAWLAPFALPWLDPKAGDPEARAVFTRLKPLHAPADLGRLLGRFGRAFVAGVPRERAPWALVRRPHDFRGAVLGALFATLPARIPFQRRALGLAPSEARDEARKYLRSQLFFLRRGAVRRQLAALPVGDRAVRDVVAEALAPLPAVGNAEILLLATPDRAPHAGDDFLAFFAASRCETSLIDLFDEDWFKNPRAVPFLIAALHDREERWFRRGTLSEAVTDSAPRRAETDAPEKASNSLAEELAPFLARAGELL